MHPVAILLVGVVIVIGGVLVLRLHAFLALVLGAFAVGALTPAVSIESYETAKSSFPVVEVETGGERRLLADVDDKVRVGGRMLIHRRGTDRQLVLLAEATVQAIEAGNGQDGKPRFRATLQVVPTADSLELQPGDLATPPHVVHAARAAAKQTVGERVAGAFGNTCGKIGILIAMAAIIGKCLLDSGAADRIVRSALGLVGERGAPAAFVASGFLLGVPVFFDTVFYLMMPLGKAMRMRTGRNYLLYVLSIVAGASMAHSLVPPTPGPLFVAEQLQVDIGLMIIAGACIGLCSSTSAYLFARFVNARAELPLRASADLTLEDLERLARRDINQLPPLWLSLLPIVLPVVLIAGYTSLKSLGIKEPQSLMPIAATLGNKNIALTIAAVIALLMLVWTRRTSLSDLATAVAASLSSGGVIILITAAGGEVGGVLQQTGVANLIRQLPPSSPAMILVLAFLITTAIRTAQGSATVAMITAVGVLSGFAADGQLGCHPVYLALAIGCGSKPIAWMNDSGFWVICKMSGMTETEGLRYVTPMSILMGLTGLAATLLAATLFPMR